ncbi:MAG: hypothetical protein K6B67_05715 [Lachnospiraceae bacterium]|nr:hypothetical protein [Lachnospiraceae bacterium]
MYITLIIGRNIKYFLLFVATYFSNTYISNNKKMYENICGRERIKQKFINNIVMLVNISDTKLLFDTCFRTRYIKPSIIKLEIYTKNIIPANPASLYNQ